MTAELVGREMEVSVLSDLLASGRLVEIVGPGRHREDGGRDRCRPRAQPVGGIRGRCASQWHLVGQARDRITANDVVDALIGAVNGPGGEAALFERLKTSSAPGHPRQLRTRHRRCRLPGGAPPRQRARTADPVHQPGTARHRRRSRLRARTPGPLRRRRAVHPPRHGTAPEREPPTWIHASVLDLCRSLDGLPLAIELAAARTKTLSVDEITRRLDDRFLVLSDPTSRRPERRRSLRSTIRWSYDLLFPDDQRGLWALATFAGGAPLPAVEYVLEALDVPAAAAIDVVGRLASRSLVIVDDDAAPPQAATPPLQEPPPRSVRYRLLDSIRAFALEALAEAGLADRARAAHAAWFAELAQGLDRRCAQPPPGPAPVLRPDRARQHRRRAGLGRHARSAARARHRQRVRLGLGRPRRQQGRPTDPRRTRGDRRRGRPSRSGHGTPARRVDRGLHGKSEACARPHRHGHGHR